MKYKLLLVAFVLFATNNLFSQSVVVNKYRNVGTTADIFELLVVQDNADLRNLVVKSFSSSNTLDNGGSISFNNIAFWSSMRAGTLIVVTLTSNAATDITTSCTDFNLNIGGSNTTYFTVGSGTFDLGNNDMCMIKSGTAPGYVGNINTLRAGAASTPWTSITTGTKLGTTSTLNGSGTIADIAYVTNASSAIGDYNLISAAGCVTIGGSASISFGVGNNANNTNFINFLRGPVSTAATSVSISSFSANWGAVTGATSYRLDVSTSSTFASFVSGYSDLNVGNVVTYPITGLNPGTPYYYRVRAVNVTPTTSGNSCTQTLTTLNGKVSVASGDWNTAGTWNPVGVPVAADNVVISAGHIVSTAIAITGATARTGTTTVDGTFQLNTGGWVSGVNFAYNATTGGLNFNSTSNYTVNNTDSFWPITLPPFNVSVLQGGLTMNSASRTVAGTFTTASGVTLTTSTLTLNATCQINTGGFFNNTPTYGNASTLVYNDTAPYSVGNEWTGNSTTAGAGVPQNVTIQNSTILNMPNSNRGLAGNLNINATGNLTLNATSGDLYVAGNWTRVSTASFTPSNRSVFFNTPTAILPQIVTVSATGTETFNYLRVQGIGTLKLATGTNVIVNASSGLTLGSTNATSTIDLNGQTLTLSGGGNLDLSAGARNITSTLAGGKVIITTADLTVTNGGSLITDTNTLIDLQRGLDCGTASLVTINGTLQINANGFCTGNSPRYGASSLLQYNNGSSYNRQLEWTSTVAATVGVGAPNNVQISSNTTLNYYNATNNGPKSIVGNLVVDAGSTFSMGSVSTAGAVTIPGNVTVAGTLSLCNSSPIVGDDLKVGGDLTFTGAGNLVGNERAIFFTNTVTQTITSAAALTIPFLVTAGGATKVKLASSITISSTATGVNVITFGNSNDYIDLNGQTLTIGSAGNPGVISGAAGTFRGAAAGPTTSSITLLGTGSIGTLTLATGFQNLGTFVMNRTASATGCVMGSAVTINTALTLTSGIIDLGTNIMTLASTCSNVFSASSTSYVLADVSALGVLRKIITATATTYNFPIGSGGTQYTPATINFSIATLAGGAYIGMAVENSKEPNMDATANYINRYWDVTSSGITVPTYSFVGTFINSAYPATGDVTGTANSSKGNQWNGTTSAWLVAVGANIVAPNITVASTTLPAISHFTAGLRDPEINIKQGITYLTGSTYTFLQTNVGSPQIVTFTIQNLGQQSLLCTGNAASSLTGTYYTSSYAGPTIPAGNSSNFTVTFTPLTAGTFTGSISIANNDTSGSENPYVIYFTCEAVCSPAAVNTITPTSGPIGTEVTITATNATDFTGGATVTFLGTVATSTTTTGTTIIKAIVPNTVINGLGTLTTMTTTAGCIASNAFTVDRNVTNTCQGGTNLSDLIISEVTDSTYGGLTYVEIYNGTGALVDLTANAYSLQFFANGSASSATQALSGTIANGATYTVATSLSGFSCPTAVTPGGDGSLANLASVIPGINFADSSTGNVALGHDHIGLYKGAVKKDSWGVYLDQTWATSLNIGDRGADFRRKNNVTLPNTTYSNSDWDIINWSGTGTSSCSNNDYSNIGTFSFLAGTPPNVTVNPTYIPSCKTASLTVAGTEGYAGGNALAYQWYAVAPGVATWTAITNGALYSGATAATLNLLNTTTLVGYQFYCQINENTSTCHSSSTAIKIVAGGTATWNGSGWVGGTPSLTNAVIINGNYDTSAIGNDSFEACSVTVNSPNVLTITTGKYVSIQNDLTVTAPGNVIVQDNGSLVQIDDNGVNTGSVDVQRIATAKLSDYVYWSSPVASFPTTSVSPTTSSALIWKWNPTVANSNNGEGSWQNAAADIMTVGKGYIVRAPNGFDNVTAADFTADFIGTPFNGIKQPNIARGDITTVLGIYPAAPYAGTNGATITQYKDNMNLVGNPFPSSINAINFLTLNTNILGYINLWTHGSLPTISSSPYYGNYAYNYAPGDYITYNVSGASTGPSAFSGYVASGQGFFVTMNDGAPDASQTVTFKNAMRSNYSAGTYTYFDNSNFYRNAANHHNTLVSQPIERNRIWLDLIGETGTATRTLVGYIEGATMEMDRLFDANISIGTSQNLFSLIADKPYNIQGRALPFDSNDTVPLGVNLPTSGTYTIAIATTDGLFHETNQGIYLEDTALNIIHDLRQAPYVFTAGLGRFDTRFVLRYTNAALGTVDFDTLDNSVVVATPNHNQISIKSYVENMKSVAVYDMLGRVVYTNNQVNLKELMISNGVLNQQALIVKITLENGLVVTKKIVL